MQVKNAVFKTNPKYDLVFERWNLYYDMKLVTFGKHYNSDLMCNFHCLYKSTVSFQLHYIK